MKKIVIFLFILTGCKSYEEKIKNTEIQYLKDYSTGLCFSVEEREELFTVNSCVPCDSLKNVKVHKINSKEDKVQTFKP